MPHRALTLGGACLLALAAGASGEEAPLPSLEDLLATEIRSVAKYDQKVREAPASVTVVTAAEIERFGYRTLAEVLTQVRGFYLSDDRNYEYLGVRGFGRPTDYNSRILLLLDGHQLNEGFYGSAPIGTDLPLDLGTLERIEIVRGPGSAVHGSGAMFAVVNLVTRSGAAADAVELEVEGGSFGRGLAAVRLGKELAGGLDLTLSGLWTQLDGEDLAFREYADPPLADGRADGLDWTRAKSGLAVVEFRGLRIEAFTSKRSKGIPTGAFGIDFGDRRAKTADQWSFLDLSRSFRLTPSSRLRLRAYFDDYHYEGSYPYDGGLFLDENQGERWGVESQWVWDASPANRVVAGVEYRDNTRASYFAADDFAVSFDRDIPFREGSIYVEDAYQLTRDLALTVGVRHDDYSDAGGSTTPRLALVHHPTAASTLKGLYGEAFRRPNHYEIYYEQLDVRANPDLEPEEIRTVELLWEQQWSPGLLTTASLYDYDMKNLITAVEDPADGSVQFQNVDRVDARGLELQVEARRADGRWASVSYVVQESEDRATGRRLSNSPRHLARAMLSLPLPRRGSASVQVRWESERTTVYDTRLGSFLVVDLHATAELFAGRVVLALHVLNAFDEAYETPGGFEHLQDGIRQRGREVRVPVTVSF